MKIENDIIWLAGLIDGEGCIHAHFVNKTKNVSSQIQVHCASKIMVDCIEKILVKQKIDYNRSDPFMQPLSTRPTHRITVRKKESILNFLNLICPFLKVKKQEALLTIKYYQKILNNSTRPSFKERESFILELKRLKRV